MNHDTETDLEAHNLRERVSSRFRVVYYIQNETAEQTYHRKYSTKYICLRIIGCLGIFVFPSTRINRGKLK